MNTRQTAQVRAMFRELQPLDGDVFDEKLWWIFASNEFAPQCFLHDLHGVVSQWLARAQRQFFCGVSCAESDVLTARIDRLKMLLTVVENHANFDISLHE